MRCGWRRFRVSCRLLVLGRSVFTLRRRMLDRRRAGGCRIGCRRYRRFGRRLARGCRCRRWGVPRVVVLIGRRLASRVRRSQLGDGGRAGSQVQLRRCCGRHRSLARIRGERRGGGGFTRGTLGRVRCRVRGRGPSRGLWCRRRRHVRRGGIRRPRPGVRFGRRTLLPSEPTPTGSLRHSHSYPVCGEPRVNRCSALQRNRGLSPPTIDFGRLADSCGIPTVERCTSATLKPFHVKHRLLAGWGRRPLGRCPQPDAPRLRRPRATPPRVRYLGKRSAVNHAARRRPHCSSVSPHGEVPVASAPVRPPCRAENDVSRGTLASCATHALQFAVSSTTQGGQAVRHALRCPSTSAIQARRPPRTSAHPSTPRVTAHGERARAQRSEALHGARRPGPDDRRHHSPRTRD